MHSSNIFCFLCFVFPATVENKQETVRPGLWRCSICTYDNEEGMSTCDICGVLRNPPVDVVSNGYNKAGLPFFNLYYTNLVCIMLECWILQLYEWTFCPVIHLDFLTHTRRRYLNCASWILWKESLFCFVKELWFSEIGNKLKAVNKLEFMKRIETLV